LLVHIAVASHSTFWLPSSKQQISPASRSHVAGGPHGTVLPEPPVLLEAIAVVLATDEVTLLVGAPVLVEAPGPLEVDPDGPGPVCDAVAPAPWPSPPPKLNWS
jgi:hypothetical protein